MNWRALGLSVGLTLASAVLVGLVPALHASRTNLLEALNDRARGSSERSGRLRSVLIVVEVALSVVLLVGSGLLLASFLKLQRTPLGFDSEGLATAFVGVPGTRYTTPVQQADFFAEVVDRLRADAPVTGAAAGIGVPLAGFNPRSPYSVEGREVLPLAQRPLAGLGIVSDGYFETMGIPLASGRSFTAADRDGATRVCLINESLARRLFPGESPLGRVLLRGRDAEIRSEIVGVIRDVKTIGPNAPTPDEIYFPMRQLGRPGMAIVARTDGDPSGLEAPAWPCSSRSWRRSPVSCRRFAARIDPLLALRE